VLAGGASRRMGADKAALPVGSTTLLGRTIATLAEVVDEVHVVGGPHQPDGATYVADQYPGEGPLGAVVSAFASIDTPVLVVVACDLPALQPVSIRTLLDALAASRADYAVPLVGGRRQWHSAVFSRTCYQVIDGAFSSGVRSYWDALGSLRECAVVVAEPGVFADVDTPEQYAEICEPLSMDQDR